MENIMATNNLTFNSYAKEVNAKIKDPALKEFLFGIDDLEGSDIKGISVLYKMMTFSFMFAYAKYKYDRDTKKIHTTTPNAKRVIDAFECIYNGEDVTLDLVIYVLTEMQLDVISVGERSYFRPFFNGKTDIQIPSLKSVISIWLQSAKRAEQNEKVLLGYFVALFENFTYLRDVSIIEDEEKCLAFGYEPYKDTIKSYSLIKKEDSESFFYLSSYEVTMNHLCRLTYQCFDGKAILREEVPVRDFLSKSSMKNHNGAPKSILAKSLSELSFKYIQHLALAVSDAITRETRRKLYEHYSMRYSDIFELGYKKDYNDINWDNAMTILMIEEGPSEVLEFLLDSDGFYFDKILRNLEVRVNEKDLASKVKAKYEEAQDMELGMVKKYATDNSAFVKNLDSINKTFMAKSIIDGLAQQKNDAHFVESLPMRIKTIDKIIAASDSAMSKALKINKVLEKTFRYIIPFYEGVIAYQLKKNEYRADVESKGLNWDVIDKNAVRLICEGAFFEAAAKSKEEVSRMPLGKLVEAFRNLTRGILEKKNGRLCISDRGRALKSAVGRNYICAYDTFENIINFTKEDVVDIVIDHMPNDITGFINNEKHDKPETLVANVVLFNKFLLKAKELLYYFIYNEDYKREMILGQQISYDPIYPYVVRYTVKSENRDGYSINNFSVFLTDDNVTSEVKILSELDYEINEKYYCIPNVETSNKRWWIDPFLISCKKFDELMYSDGKKEKKDNEDN